MEIRNQQLRADSSQGTHFFQNITSLGIHYITVTDCTEDRFDWKIVESLPAIQETVFLNMSGRERECS